MDDLRKYHGDAFFTRATDDDAIADVLGRMIQKNVEVGIVVDDRGRPTHCFTQTELKALLNSQR